MEHPDTRKKVPTRISGEQRKDIHWEEWLKGDWADVQSLVTNLRGLGSSRAISSRTLSGCWKSWIIPRALYFFYTYTDVPDFIS